MGRRAKYDKLVWLEKHGRFTTNIRRTNLEQEWIAWMSHGGTVTSAAGDTIKLMYDNLFDEVKEGLYRRCKDNGFSL